MIKKRFKADDVGAFAALMRDVREQYGDAEIVIMCKKYKRIRSLKQNRYYWGVVVPHVREGLDAIGTVVDDEEAHGFLKRFVMKLTRRIPLNAIITCSTTGLTPAEFEDKLEVVRAFAAETLQVNIPLPNEEAALDYYEQHNF